MVGLRELTHIEKSIGRSFMTCLDIENPFFLMGLRRVYMW
jgi:hypothetical protein